MDLVAKQILNNNAKQIIVSSFKAPEKRKLFRGRGEKEGYNV